MRIFRDAGRHRVDRGSFGLRSLGSSQGRSRHRQGAGRAQERGRERHPSGVSARSKFLPEQKAASAASLDDLKAASAKNAGQGAEWAKLAEPAKAGFAEFKAAAAKAMPTEALPFEALSGAKSNRDPAIGKPASSSLR